MPFKLMPALLKCDVGTFAQDAILDGHSPIILESFLDSFLSTFFEARWRDDLPVYGCFLDWGCWPGPLFRPVLVPTLARVFAHLEIRLSIPPHLNCSDVCLPIANKSAHPQRVRFLGK
jgi:hypothetical protein